MMSRIDEDFGKKEIMLMYEFAYAFQLDKKRIFNVAYYTLCSNPHPDFSTAALLFNQPKTDYTMCGQCQSSVCTGLAKAFFEKWDRLHLKDIPDQQTFDELISDIEKLKAKYNYLEYKMPEGKRLDTVLYNGNIPFMRVKELSMQTPKKVQTFEKIEKPEQNEIDMENDDIER